MNPHSLLRSSGYVAPEILRSPVSNGYKNNVDIFSAGVTLYVLLCGYEPFYGECDTELIASNRKASVEYPDEDWRRSRFYLFDIIRLIFAACVIEMEQILTDLFSLSLSLSPPFSTRPVSIEGRDLVERMLHHDPEKRITASEALKHPWITRRAPAPSKTRATGEQATSKMETIESACVVQ